MAGFVNILKRTDIFYDLTPMLLEMISAICEEKNVRAGQVIFEESSPGNELYVIVRGEVEILGPSGCHKVAHLRA